MKFKIFASIFVLVILFALFALFSGSGTSGDVQEEFTTETEIIQ